MGTYFKPYKIKRSFEEISDEIKKLIFQGTFKPGDKLPSETEIARQFNVSRQTIRETMHILEQSGFITIQQGVNGGPFISDTILNRLSILFLDIFYFKKVSLEELTEARFDIEKVMLGRVIERADDSDLKALKDNIAEAKARIKSNVTPFEENTSFHKLLARASKNYIYVIVIEALMAVVSDFHSRLEKVNLERSKRITKHHEDILQAIMDRNHARAVDLLDNLLKDVGAILGET